MRRRKSRQNPLRTTPKYTFNTRFTLFGATHPDALTIKFYTVCVLDLKSPH